MIVTMSTHVAYYLEAIRLVDASPPFTYTVQAY